MKEKILLTGGNGYIGSVFLDMYISDYNFRVIDSNFYDYDILENVEFIKKDIRHVQEKDLEGIDYVVHMAELSNDPLGEIIPNITNEINHLGTKNLLNICKKTGIKKFIYMSSCSVYGINENLVNEESELNPLTNYSKAKVNNENFIFSQDFPFEVIILRNATVFGFSKNLRLDLVINELTFTAVNENIINLKSDGTPVRPFVHVVDLVRIINIFLNNSSIKNTEVINVGSNRLNYSIIQVVDVIKDLLQIQNINIGKEDPDQRSYRVDFSKLSNMFPQFEFQYDLAKGVRELSENLQGYGFNESSIRVDYLKDKIKKGDLDHNLFPKLEL